MRTKNILGYEFSLLPKEGASAPETERKRKKRNSEHVGSASGVITIEAAFAIPLFLFAVLCLIWMIEMQSIKVSIINSAQSAAKKAAEDTAVLPVLNTVSMKSDMISLIGEERISRSIIKGGTSGISCSRSYVNPGTGEMNITVRYEIRLPLPMFGSPSAELEETFRISAWTGSRDSGEEASDGSIVYVTDHAAVWHEDMNCSYLRLSIRFIPAEELELIRNISGGIYHPCEKCVYGTAMTGVYITQSGGRYHNSLSCSGLKRTIHAVRREDVSWLGGCSRCTE